MPDIRKYFNIISKNNDVLLEEGVYIKSKLDTHNINIFTDGSAKNNGKTNVRGGIGIFIEDTNECISEKITGVITNNIAELKACIKGINYIINRDGYKNQIINIYSDSEYVIKSITVWSKKWYKNEWKKYDKFKKKNIDISNKELIIELYTLYNKHNIIFIHTKSHSVKPINENTNEYKIWYGNYMADKLAVDSC